PPRLPCLSIGLPSASRAMARGARAGRRRRDLGWSAPGSGRTPFAPPRSTGHPPVPRPARRPRRPESRLSPVLDSRAPRAPTPTQDTTHVQLRSPQDRRHEEPARAQAHAAARRAHERARELGEVALRRADPRAGPRLAQGSSRYARAAEVGGARPHLARLLRADPRIERPRAGHAPF